MSTQIGRRLNRLETRLGVSENAPKIDHIIVLLRKTGPQWFQEDVRAGELDSGKIVYRGADETFEDFQSRIRRSCQKKKKWAAACRL